jgi:hypothetical protein
MQVKSRDPEEPAGLAGGAPRRSCWSPSLCAYEENWAVRAFGQFGHVT